MSTQRLKPSASKTPLQIGVHGNVLCRYCRGAIPPHRKTFCSNDCVHEWKVRTNKGYLLDVVKKRDKGICAHCGKDCIELENKLKQAAKNPFTVPTLWRADHKRAVFRNGGACGLGNYQTLCIPCHNTKTAHEREERDEAKRKAKFREVLLCIEFFGATQQELSRKFQVAPRTINSWVAILKKDDLICRQNGHLFLTDKGEKWLNDAVLEKPSLIA